MSQFDSALMTSMILKKGGWRGYRRDRWRDIGIVGGRHDGAEAKTLKRADMPRYLSVENTHQRGWGSILS
jgi:hypothetical protein